MIVHNGTLTGDSTSFRMVEGQGSSLYYRGLVFLDGMRCGDDSARQILSEYQASKAIDFAAIRGAFLIFLVDRDRNEVLVFSDNSGMTKPYLSGHRVSSSFLELCRSVGRGSVAVDPEAYVEFMQFGAVYFGRTVIRDIASLNREDYVVCGPGRAEIRSKRITPLTEPADIDFTDRFQKMVESIRHKRVAVDLTGGSDSRLILSMLHSFGLEPELAISGMKHNTDIRIAQEVADQLKRPLRVTYHDATKVSLAGFRELTDVTDGVGDVLNYHRNYQMMKEQTQRGVEVRLGGEGGELYKDFFWIQDFPFYWKSTSNLDRLFETRWRSARMPEAMFPPATAMLARNQKAQFLGKLASYTLGRNTQTYDNIYYNIKLPAAASLYIAAGSRFYLCYPPLHEHDLVRFGFHLPRRERFFNNFHRQTISDCCPQIAGIVTTDRTTCRSSGLHKGIDMFGYGVDKTKRLMKQSGRRLFNRTYMQETPNDPSLFKNARTIPEVEQIQSRMKDLQLLDSSVHLSKLPDPYFGRALSFGLMLDAIA